MVGHVARLACIVEWDAIRASEHRCGRPRRFGRERRTDGATGAQAADRRLRGVIVVRATWLMTRAVVMAVCVGRERASMMRGADIDGRCRDAAQRQRHNDQQQYQGPANASHARNRITRALAEHARPIASWISPSANPAT